MMGRKDESVPLWYLFGSQYDGYTQPMADLSSTRAKAPPTVREARLAATDCYLGGPSARRRVETEGLNQMRATVSQDRAERRQERFLEPTARGAPLAHPSRIDALANERARLKAAAHFEVRHRRRR